MKDLEVALNAANDLRESSQQQLYESGIQCNALRKQAESDEESLRVAKKIAIEAKDRDDAQKHEIESMKMEVLHHSIYQERHPVFIFASLHPC